MENTIVIVLFVILFFLVYIFFKEIKKQKKAEAKLKSNKNIQARLGNTIRYQYDNSLDKKLLSMLGGDKKAVLRLMKNIRKNYPNKSHIWCQEKVLRDLERDRGY